MPFVTEKPNSDQSAAARIFQYAARTRRRGTLFQSQAKRCTAEGRWSHGIDGKPEGRRTSLCETQGHRVRRGLVFGITEVVQLSRAI